MIVVPSPLVALALPTTDVAVGLGIGIGLDRIISIDVGFGCFPNLPEISCVIGEPVFLGLVYSTISGANSEKVAS